MTDVVPLLGTLPPCAVLLAVFALPALEASTFLGLVVAGGGSSAASWPSRPVRHAAVMAAAVAGAGRR